MEQASKHLDKSGVPREDCWVSRWKSSRRLPLANLPSAAIDREAVAAKVYSPLKQWQTRILCVEAGMPGEPLITKLLEADLIFFEGVGITKENRMVFYDALSYSWGYPEFTHAVKCNGFDFPVTISQLEALERLRYPNNERYVWIDAICIDQFNKLEKNLQIRNMYTIFKKAVNVIVWLGEKDACGARAVEILSQGQNPDGLLPMPQCRDCRQDIYEDLRKLSKRPWFRRTWVRQEVAAARELVA